MIPQKTKMDGGNMKIVDIKENNDYYEMYVRYLGACDKSIKKIKIINSGKAIDTLLGTNAK